MRTLALLMFSTILLNAATYTVKSAGGGNYTTIQACATAMSPGDTCTVYAGTYSEHVSVSSGATGNYKTLNVNGSDLVHVLSFTLGSHTHLVGFQIQNPSSPSGAACVSVGSSTDVFITNNVMTQCGSGSMITENSSASYVYIQGNTLSWACRTPSAGTACDGIGSHGNHILIENNDVSHYRLGVNFQAQYGIYRNNSLHDQYETDSGQHTDAFFSEPETESSQYQVIEGNTQNNAVGPNAKGILSQGDACSGNCFNLIVRFNAIYHVDSGIIVDENAGNSGVNPGFYNVKVYNNTLVDVNRVGSSGSSISNNYMNHSINAADLNNIYYWPGASTVLNAYACDSSVCSSMNYGHNLAYCGSTGSANCAIKGHLYNSGTFASDPGNIMVDPKFVNYAGNDFSLSTGSPAIGAGTYLTTVAAGDSGSGINLVVSDASFFQDSFGITGVIGDCISVTTVGNHVCITAINYSTNTLTLASSITRSAGNPVWLYSDSTGRQVLVGSAPNMGATFQPPSSTPPPTIVSSIVQ